LIIAVYSFSVGGIRKLRVFDFSIPVHLKLFLEIFSANLVSYVSVSTFYSLFKSSAFAKAISLITLVLVISTPLLGTT